MITAVLHNPHHYMADLRQILAQGRKRIGLFIGAGAPMAIHVDDDGKIVEKGRPLVPDVAGLTEAVVNAVNPEDRRVLDLLKEGIAGDVNIEAILTRVRRLAEAIGDEEVYGLDGSGYDDLARRICEEIGRNVGARLPTTPNPFSEFVSWISGTQREHSVEIFTPNYDLLLEEAFERARAPYFDGFTGAHAPFFDPASVSLDELPARWSRLWKLHGSLGWKLADGTVTRTGARDATELIYPDHLKYDSVTKLPYAALFERLREFLKMPDTLLISTGFSFFDSHILAVLDEALAANAHSALLAFQYRVLEEEKLACRLAFRRPNMSVYARDGAVVGGVAGCWLPGPPPSRDRDGIGRSYWADSPREGAGVFLLGDFGRLAQFLALTQAQQLAAPTFDDDVTDEESGESPIAAVRPCA